MTKTPGFNQRLTIRFRFDRLGRPFAEYLSREAGWRWIRMSYDQARELCRIGEADGVVNLTGTN